MKKIKLETYLQIAEPETYRKALEFYDNLDSESEDGLKTVPGTEYIRFLHEKGEAHVNEMTESLFGIKKGSFHWKTAKGRVNTWCSNNGLRLAAPLVERVAGKQATFKLTTAAFDAETGRKEKLKPIPPIPGADAAALNTPIDTKQAPAVATGGKGK
jgi:hypothetical protein